MKEFVFNISFLTLKLFCAQKWGQVSDTDPVKKYKQTGHWAILMFVEMFP